MQAILFAALVINQINVPCFWINGGDFGEDPNLEIEATGKRLRFVSDQF